MTVCEGESHYGAGEKVKLMPAINQWGTVTSANGL